MRQLLQSALLYVLLDVRQSERQFTETVDALLLGGVDVIQLRDKRADEFTLLQRSRILKERIAAAKRPVLFVMNDSPDLAVQAGADAVHLGQEDLAALPMASLRKKTGGMLVGISTHSLPQALHAAAAGADYIGAGPVFPSATKTFTEFAGLDYLRQVSAVVPLPIFAIGGLTLDRLAEVQRAGIRRAAVSAAILSADSIRTAAAEWKCRLTNHRETLTIDK